MSRVLIIEDDSRIRESVAQGLRDNDFVVEDFPAAEEALEAVRRYEPDVALIDIMLPGIDGIDACRHIRQLSDIPIIMVSARGDTDDVVRGLDAGADDYVTKPFELPELIARIRAHLRRRPAAINRFTVGHLEVVPDEGICRTLDGQDVHLTTTEMKLLGELAASNGKVLSREDLLERVWGYDYFGDGRLVDVHIRRLRLKVEPDAAQPQHVVTVRGAGYKLIP